MMFKVRFCSLGVMVRRFPVMSVSKMSVVGSLFVVSALMMLRRFMVVLCRMFMMLGSIGVVLCRFFRV